jgi:hypothetical protein
MGEGKSIAPIGAGAAKSLGKKIRALTAINATAKINTTRKGATYCRKNAITDPL